MKRAFIGSAACVLVGFGLPQIEVAMACMRPISEGCVWGRALIGVNTAATLIIVGVPCGFLVSWLMRRRK